MVPFRFKQFEVHQDKSAMKIGTDAVLLGAWADISHHPTCILDIGTGTGILALQLAQRTNNYTTPPAIHSIEIELSAYNEAVFNIQSSPWKNRLTCLHTSLQSYAHIVTTTYDLIISNPPYFNNSFTSERAERNKARQTNSLPFSELISISSSLLSPTGKAAFIIPYEVEQQFIDIASENNLYPYKITRVKGNLTSKIKRSLLMLSYENKDFDVHTISIEIERHLYTEEYISIVKDFYLKM